MQEAARNKSRAGGCTRHDALKEMVNEQKHDPTGNSFANHQLMCQGPNSVTLSKRTGTLLARRVWL